MYRTKLEIMFYAPINFPFYQNWWEKYFRAAWLAAHSRMLQTAFGHALVILAYRVCFSYAECAATMAAPFGASKIFWIKNSSNPLYFIIFRPYYLFFIFNF